MGRLSHFLILLLVLTTGSALSLACAFACQTEQGAMAAAPVSHCHQAKFPDGDGIRPLQARCPVMDALPNEGDRSLQPVVRTPVSPIAFLPFESSRLVSSRAAASANRIPLHAPALRPSPPFSRSLVLRL
ncbi:MAG: hypothetical protein EOP11_10590 [Proteobacteria bacterium]|nr:MAG: hypothetical protein EOP11_10590 [Pseudomonadota bacterium]